MEGRQARGVRPRSYILPDGGGVPAVQGVDREARVPQECANTGGG